MDSTPGRCSWLLRSLMSRSMPSGCDNNERRRGAADRIVRETRPRTLVAVSVYLDHAASTPMRPEAIVAMQPFLADHPGNPSGGHGAARATKTALEAARELVAAVCGAAPHEIVFTGGGSEGDNLAIKGAAWAARARDPKLDGIVTTGIEHKAVLGACARLARDEYRVTVVGARTSGTVDLDELGAALDERTAVVSVMLVNNETGVRQPLADVATLVRERAPRAWLHTDAVQAPQWCDLRDTAAPANLVAISGHKFGGPKGVGALVVRDGVELVPLVEGGGHEHELRAGTQNVAGIVAFATALEITDHASRRGDGAHRCAPRSIRARARDPDRGLRTQRRQRASRRGFVARGDTGDRGRGVARRPRSAGGVRGVGFGV